MLIELGLEEKLITITGDNASNNISMVNALHLSLEERLGVGRPRLCGTDSYIRCLAHIINLVVQDILSSLKSITSEEADSMCESIQRQEMEVTPDKSVLERLSIFAVWVSRSNQHRTRWKEMCRFRGLDDKFIQRDVKTRWNSCYRMVKDALEAREQIDRFIGLEHQLPPFSLRDWERLQQIAILLEPFDDATLFLSRRRPQMSLIVPVYYKLHDLFENSINRQGIFSRLDRDMVQAARSGLEKFRKYYRRMDANDTYYAALILDPRVKGELLKKSLSDEVAARDIYENTRELLHTIYGGFSVMGNAAPPRKEEETYDDMLLNDIEGDMLREVESDAELPSSDIDRYFDGKQVSVPAPRHDNWLFDWWRAHKTESPYMATAARDFLAIPGTEVSVERVFSEARGVLQDNRHSLKGNTIRALMLSRDMYK